MDAPPDATNGLAADKQEASRMGLLKTIDKERKNRHRTGRMGYAAGIAYGNEAWKLNCNQPERTPGSCPISY